MIRERVSRGVRWIRALVGWSLFASGMYRRMIRGKALVVLFHRLDDDLPGNPITCSGAEFERYVRFLTRYFNVISLGELLGRLQRGEDVTRTASITFDDGYLDNATVAAPILEHHGARACFFVTTDYIGSTTVPPWDATRQITSEWMTWDQVRALKRAGHEIGSHTRTHADLGVIKGEAARAEIAGGRQRLETELGESADLFAYPFGWRGGMAEDNLKVVRELGFSCNLSGYGGTVQIGDDPLRLKRTAVTDWFVSPYQLGYELATGVLEAEPD